MLNAPIYNFFHFIQPFSLFQIILGLLISITCVNSKDNWIKHYAEIVTKGWIKGLKMHAQQTPLMP